MAGRRADLRLYGAASRYPPIPWDDVDQKLAAAGTYWVVARSPGTPHPRPVWGIWFEQRIYLSIGSPALRRDLREERAVAVHLGSGTDVVVVEGLAVVGGPGVPERANDPAVIAAYNTKYDWAYDTAQYGPFTEVQPTKILAWRTAGPNGRDGFEATSCWLLGS